jgi:predicted GH43/DUF377 family glycosyl hydrolase
MRGRVSRRLFLTAVGGGGLTAAAGLAGRSLLRTSSPVRTYLPYVGETTAGWRKFAGNPVLGGKLGSCFDICVLHEYGLYRMWFSWRTMKSIGYTESVDGIHWSRPFAGPIFRPSPNGWDRQRVTAPQVIHRDGWYFMFYIGFYNEVSAEIGLARSRDGIRGWERLPTNPIIRPAHNSSRWDYDAVYRPWALADESGWLLWYNGRRGDLEQIGLARHEGLDLWT